MANYFILQTNDKSKAYAFKVAVGSYNPEKRRNQREQFTVTGKLDVQGGPNEMFWNYGVKLHGEETGSFSVTPGAIVTASSVSWGDYDDLLDLFDNVIPPNNKLRFRDIDGNESYIYFSNVLRPKPLTTIASGEGAYLTVDITMRGSS